MSVTTIQHPKVRRPPQLPDDLRRELDLMLEASQVRQDLYLTIQAEIEDGADTGVRRNTLDVLDLLISDEAADLDRKIQLYRRFKDHPYDRSLPDRSSDRYQKLLAIAADLKTLWPAEQFARDVLGVTLHQHGKKSVGLCPFHQERTPSFTVYPDSDTFWCFGCFQRGDGIDIFAMIGRWQNIPGFRQQVEWLASFSRGWFGGRS